MTREDIIRMAKQAGFERLGHDEHDYVCYPDDILAFAAFVASAEREAILQISRDQWFKTQADFEEAIRAREQA